MLDATGAVVEGSMVGGPDVPDTAEPIAGDWNGDGTTTIGLRHGNRFLLRSSNSTGPAHYDFRYGREGVEVVAGDWNANGTDTVGIRRGDRYFRRTTNTGGPAHLDFRYG